MIIQQNVFVQISIWLFAAWGGRPPLDLSRPTLNLNWAKVHLVPSLWLQTPQQVMFQQIDSVVCMFVIWRIPNLSSSTHLTWLHNAIHRSLPPNRSSNLVRNKLNVTRTQNKTTFFEPPNSTTAPSSQILRSFAKTLHIVLALVSIAFSAGELVYLLMLKVRASWQNQTKQEFISWISLFEPTQLR